MLLAGELLPSDFGIAADTGNPEVTSARHEPRVRFQLEPPPVQGILAVGFARGPAAVETRLGGRFWPHPGIGPDAEPLQADSAPA